MIWEGVSGPVRVIYQGQLTQDLDVYIGLEFLAGSKGPDDT